MRVSTLALVLAGCSTDPSGIWLLDFPVETPDPQCTEQTGENFFYGQWPVEETSTDSAWTYEDAATYANELAFAQIETTADGAVLILGDTVVTGTYSKKSKKWTFAWTADTSTSTSETHSAGYSYSEWDDNSSTLEITFALADDGHGDGTSSASTVSRMTWTETDVWDSATTGVSYGQTPSSSYLEASDGSGSAIDNTSSAADCEDTTCTLWVQTSCALSDTFSAVRTDFETEDAYNGLSNVTDPS